ncbi:hypothetical protein LMG29542_08489 [Paraburkholderia humisilvae]|uniref:Uncharacterized protein n=1 Tax=Paraburkholderia humisilvae TaxID=627669 RepID=A0A6J5FCC6_9BURK|nr:hypothetical protein LMG29542_08489 [Paraburkholderia humisilvae]
MFRVIEQIRNNLAGPTHWGLNESGMLAGQEVEDLLRAKTLWREAAENAITVAEKMMELCLHKQVVNRILEPFSTISAVVTATEWSNWYELRDHEDAQPEIRDLAQAMRQAVSRSSPREVGSGKLDDAHT